MQETGDNATRKVVDVTTHLRGRAVQAGAFLVLVAGLVAGGQTAALAATPTVNITAPSSGNSGDTVTVTYTVGNPGGSAESADTAVPVKITTTLVGGACNSGCGNQNVTLKPGEDTDGSATIVLPTIGEGQKQDITFQVEATSSGDAPGTKTAVAKIRVNGPAAPADTNVRLVTGTIKDKDGNRLAGASVGMVDSQGHKYTAITNNDGGFSFASSDTNPISAGSITVGATLEGFKGARTTVKGTVGKTVSASITLKALAASASASPSASVSASASSAVSEEPTDDEATDDATTDPANTLAADTDNKSDDSGGSSWLLIVMGGLLVAAGVGAMVLVWLRRKNAAANGDDTNGGGAGYGGAPIGGGPAGGPRYGNDATRVAAPVGAGRGGDATMVAGAGGMGAALSDAPTMIHRPAVVEDEFPDPYGAPVPPQGGYLGTNSSQWDDQGGYGAAGTGAAGGYGAATSGYDAQADGYGQATNMYQPEQPQQPQPGQRYDEATGMYQPNNGYEDDGYGAGGYAAGQQAGGYDQGGYGNQAAGQAGWGNQGGQAGWGNQPDNGDGYGPAGYEQGGYEQGGGNYGAQPPAQPAGYEQGGYGNQGYDQHGGNYGGAQQPPVQPGQPGYGTQGYDQRGNAYGNGQDPNRRGRDWEE
ncbi:hypothetical protein Apa02nite_028450 [Actinoplanes palleronii]|uniref:Carboxypeptidase family protein n=1 Tax=Actinoplanes palleronii TaxID=113570 RepID=A0ABQ4B7W2_9ACTN|nr:hypothetical protein Apa02nite_028450 [Actinoplanes palleronii]